MDKQVSREFIDKVEDAVKGDDRFSEDGIAELFAHSVALYSEPFGPSAFDSDKVEFSDEQSSAIDGYMEKLEEYQEFLSEQGDAIPEQYEYDDEDSDEDDEFENELLNELGLDDDATQGDVLARVQELNHSEGAEQFTEEDREILDNLKSHKLALEYQERLSNVEVIGMSKDEAAMQLADAHERFGEAAATQQLELMSRFSQVADTAQVTKNLLSTFAESNEDDDAGEARRKIENFADGEEIDFESAVVRFAQGTPAQKSVYRSYRSERLPI